GARSATASGWATNSGSTACIATITSPHHRQLQLPSCAEGYPIASSHMEGACDGEDHGRSRAASVSALGARPLAQRRRSAGGPRSENGAEVSGDETASQRRVWTRPGLADTARSVRRGLAGGGRT